MKKLISILVCLSFLIMILVIVFVIPKLEDKEKVTLEQVQSYEIPDATVRTPTEREILTDFQFIEVESGETYVFNIYGSYKVTEIIYLKESVISYGESEAHVCGKFLYESIEKPEILYEQSVGFLHYRKRIPVDINLNYGDIYHKVVFYNSSEPEIAQRL